MPIAPPVKTSSVDLAIIGGGFWGIAVALEASLAHLNVVVLDNGNPKGASRNAAGIVCKHWYKQDTITKMLPPDWSYSEIEKSIEWLGKFGLIKTGEEFSSYSNWEKRPREDCYLVSSCEAITAQFPVQNMHVHRLLPESGRVVIESAGATIHAKHVVVAAGAYTDELLASSGLPTVGVRKLRGRAIVATGPAPALPWTHMSRPYTHYTLREWPKGALRLGDTVEKTLDGEDGQLESLRRLLKTMEPSAVEQAVLDGIRPVCQKFTVAKVADRVIVATGGHRVGLGLAGLVANRCLDLIKGDKLPNTLDA